MLNRLSSCVLIVPFILVGCIAAAEPGDPGEADEHATASFGHTGTAAEALTRCPGTEEPCTCTGGIHNGQTECTSNIAQCFEYCTGHLP